MGFKHVLDTNAVMAALGNLSDTFSAPRAVSRATRLQGGAGRAVLRLAALGRVHAVACRV